MSINKRVQRKNDLNTWPVAFAVYAAGDAAGSGTFASLENHLVQQINSLELIVTNPYVVGIAQLDSQKMSSLRWVLDPQKRFRPIRIGETNTGDPNTLVDFVRWADQVCSSQKFILTLSGHGLAFQNQVVKRLVSQGRGLLMDGSDYLGTQELIYALRKVSHVLGQCVDVVVLDACLMSNFEMMWELESVVKSIVGAEDEISATGLNLAGAAERIRDHAKSNNMSTKNLAGSFPLSYTPKWDTDSCVAIDLEDGTFLKAAEDFSRFTFDLFQWVKQNPEKKNDLKYAISESSENLVRYNQKSLSDFLALRDCLSKVLPQHLTLKLERVIRKLQTSIIHKSVGQKYKNALGISIFCPTSKRQFKINREDYSRLKISTHTQWLSVLDMIFD